MRIRDGVPGWRVDRVTVEEPLELRLDGHPLTVTMRTPGDDFDLAVGFMLCEGVIDDAAQVSEIRSCGDAEPNGHYNRLDVILTAGAPGLAAGRERAFVTTSACGICGSASIEAVASRPHTDVTGDPLRLSPELIASLPGRLAAHQRGFAATGGLHAAALFDASGELVCIREDVGRHNAFDKVVGWAATARRLPLRSHVILASGRASFELTQKALVAGIPCLVAVSAPSSLAIDLARHAGMTLVGFVRGTTMNVYTGHERVCRYAAMPPPALEG
jgi:FdhD protein